jgi:hypothetical protein
MNKNNFFYSKNKKVNFQSKEEFPDLKESHDSSKQEESVDLFYKNILTQKNCNVEKETRSRKKGWIYLDKDNSKIKENVEDGDIFSHKKACIIMQELVDYLEKRKNEYIDTHGIDDYIKNFGDYYVVEEDDDYENFYDDLSNNQDDSDWDWDWD